MEAVRIIFKLSFKLNGFSLLIDESHAHRTLYAFKQSFQYMGVRHRIGDGKQKYTARSFIANFGSSINPKVDRNKNFVLVYGIMELSFLSSFCGALQARSASEGQWRLPSLALRA